jgi:Sec-independent protein translocase protein TatA
MPGIGPMELIVVLIVALIVLGPSACRPPAPARRP